MRVRLEDYLSPIGTVRMAVRLDGKRGEALCALGFEDGWERLVSQIRSRLEAGEPWIEAKADSGPRATGAMPGNGPRVAGPFLQALSAYFNGDARALDAVPVDLMGTEFQREVWAALRTIPPGRTLSYGDLAKQIGHPTAVRAVGAANGANPVSLVVPCHRVIAADGTLGGYGWGLERKRWLLAHEGALSGALLPGECAPRSSGGTPGPPPA
jgi:O-6-methylguanine DNA methyltransferase